MRRFPLLIIFPVFLCLLPSAGCDKQETPLELKDLTEGESLYVTRFIILERAKAVTLADRPTGTSLLDSLSVAWGDSSLEKTMAGIDLDPRRSAKVHELLVNVLRAERDSLMDAPRPDRLSAPLPNPEPEPKPLLKSD